MVGKKGKRNRTELRKKTKDTEKERIRSEAMTAQFLFLRRLKGWYLPDQTMSVLQLQGPTVVFGIVRLSQRF
jgi:hypothetical protein